MASKKEEVEIDLLELVQKLWNKKKFILKVSLIGALVGIIVAFSIPKEYTSTVILTSEAGRQGGGGMNALASMAGINLGAGGSGDVFSPDLYSNILNSTPFVQGLFNVEVRDAKQNINATIYDYIKNDQKKAWWGYVLNSIGSLTSLFSTEEDSFLTSTNRRFISKNDMDIIDAIKNSYNISTDKKTGVTIIEATAQSPIISALLADTLASYLQTYIIEQRTKKAKKDLDNTKSLYEKSRKDYEKAQLNLANFLDRNKNIALASFQTNQKKLENEANLAYSMYNQIAQQVQVGEIKVQDDTPVFTIIQPAIEPLYPESPKKKLIVVGLILLSFIVASGWVLAKDYLEFI